MSGPTLPRVALSVQQPWAELIARGYKDVENRTWRTRFRGRVLIHASRRFDEEGWGRALELSANVAGVALAEPHRFERGGIVGVATVVDCVEASESPWFFGPFGFVLTDARPLPFMPLKGALGFFAAQYAPAEARDA